MLYRPSSFRKTAFAMTAIAAIVGASTLGTFSANAQQVTVNTNCHDYKPGVLMADTKCEILKGRALDAQGRALDAQRGALDAHGNTLDAQNACIAELVKFKTASPERAKEFAREFGPVTRENACDAAG